MELNELKAELKCGELSGVYVLAGEEDTSSATIFPRYAVHSR